MSGGCITHPADRTTGNVGAPVACCQLKLIDEVSFCACFRASSAGTLGIRSMLTAVSLLPSLCCLLQPDMGYHSTDHPRPRGQICIGGPNVTLGYYGEEKMTHDSYFTDSEGVRYFKTGDIGEWTEDGTLRIFDRKKDLVKLSHGEYIALGNLESKYCSSPLIDNICIVADSHHGAPAALAAVNHNNLVAMAQEMGVPDTDVEHLVNNPTIVSAVLAQLSSIASQNKFEKWEKLAAIKLYAEPWTPQAGLLTEAMKLKRHEINKQFKEDIKALYKRIP